MLLPLLLSLLLLQLENPFWQNFKFKFCYFSFSLSFIHFDYPVEPYSFDAIRSVLIYKMDSIHGKRTANAKKIKVAYCVSYMHIFLCMYLSLRLLHPFSTLSCVSFSLLTTELMVIIQISNIIENRIRNSNITIPSK